MAQWSATVLLEAFIGETAVLPSHLGLLLLLCFPSGLLLCPSLQWSATVPVSPVVCYCARLSSGPLLCPPLQWSATVPASPVVRYCSDERPPNGELLDNNALEEDLGPLPSSLLSLPLALT